MNRLKALAILCCGWLPVLAGAFEEPVGRLKLVDAAAGWRVVSRLDAPGVLLDQGVSGAIPSSAILVALRPDGSDVDPLIMVVRASNSGGGQRVTWSQACENSANIVATRMTRNFSLPDCFKLSGNLSAGKFVSTALPPVHDASTRGELKLPTRARYFSILVGLETGSFASVAGLIDSKTPGSAEWVQEFAETLRRGNLSLDGAVAVPALPSLATQR